MERCTKGIAHLQENISIMRLDALFQDLIMPRHQTGRGLRKLLRKPGGALDISKKECDRARGKVGHTESIQD